MKKVIIPRENEKDVPADVRGIEVILAGNIEEVVEHLFEPLKEQSLVG